MAVEFPPSANLPRHIAFNAVYVVLRLQCLTIHAPVMGSFTGTVARRRGHERAKPKWTVYFLFAVIDRCRPWGSPETLCEDWAVSELEIQTFYQE